KLHPSQDSDEHLQQAYKDYIERNGEDKQPRIYCATHQNTQGWLFSTEKWSEMDTCGKCMKPLAHDQFSVKNEIQGSSSSSASYNSSSSSSSSNRMQEDE